MLFEWAYLHGLIDGWISLTFATGVGWSKDNLIKDIYNEHGTWQACAVASQRLQISLWGRDRGQLCEMLNIVLLENNDEDIVEAAHVCIVHVSMEPQ